MNPILAHLRHFIAAASMLGLSLPLGACTEANHAYRVIEISRLAVGAGIALANQADHHAEQSSLRRRCFNPSTLTSYDISSGSCAAGYVEAKESDVVAAPTPAPAPYPPINGPLWCYDPDIDLIYTASGSFSGDDPRISETEAQWRMAKKGTAGYQGQGKLWCYDAKEDIAYPTRANFCTGDARQITEADAKARIDAKANGTAPAQAAMWCYDPASDLTYMPGDGSCGKDRQIGEAKAKARRDAKEKQPPVVATAPPSAPSRPASPPAPANPSSPPAQAATPPAKKEPLPPALGQCGSWQRANLTMPSQTRSSPMSPPDLYKSLVPSVYFIVAGKTVDGQGKAVASGSAVAVSKRLLLTNCHVIAGLPIILVVKDKQISPARLAAGHQDSDRCILQTEQEVNPIRGVRATGSLEIGERVYTIGNPEGLQLTLGEGLVSNLRTRENVVMIQTTAHMTYGSSGGALFDSMGNLIGITTSGYGESGFLNFAIAADEYWR